jgi:hypothetical protein
MEEAMIALFRPALRGAAVLAGLTVLAAGAVSAAGAATALKPYHEPPWLLQPHRPVGLAYALLPAGVTGSVYVRNDTRRTFTRLPLVEGPYCPGDPADAAAMRRDKVCGTALVARVPGGLVSGARLYYYAVLRRNGTAVTVPSGGAAAPQRVWIVAREIQVALGRHRFGHLRAPDAIVARATQAQVRLSCCADPPGGDGPSSFDVGPDGSIWLLDRLNHRVLVWRRGVSGRAARSVPLPRNLAVEDVALGPGGTIYARATDLSASGRSGLYAFTPRGRIRWYTPLPSGIPTSQLQLGPDGVVYASTTCGLGCAPFGGNALWVPLTTPEGAPLTPAERTRRATPFEPLPGGLRLVSELSYTVARFALIDRSDNVVRAWRVTSTTQLGAVRAAPALAAGRLVVPLDVSAGARWEQLVVRLAPTGGSAFALAARPVLGGNLLAPLRVGPDGRLYQLRTDVKTGATVAAYSL